MTNIDLIKTPLSWAFVVLGVAFYFFRKLQKAKKVKSIYTPDEKPAPVYSEEAYCNIDPLTNFDLDNEEPLKLRPFKPAFHLTMAIENTTFSDFIVMDNTYRERLAIRSSLIHNEHHEVVACTPAGASAVLEIYTWLVITYLPRRFPTLFIPTGTHLLNKVTGAFLPLTPSSPEAALELLGSNIDDEFLFLLPSSDPADNGAYRLVAFVNCFPSGFNTRSKLGLLLADIHGPVPGYAAKIGKSMDRFFSRMETGRIVRRANWGISTSGDLFCLSGNHMSEEEAARREREEEKVNLKTTVLRCERQTLHRLPNTRALVFAFKTYQYPIAVLRDEGNGEALATAIDGLQTGSVPGMAVYKRQVVWGEKVKAFLRGEIEIDDEHPIPL